MKKRLYLGKRTKAGDDYNTESLAKFAFSILWQAAKFSLENGTVILFDY